MKTNLIQINFQNKKSHYSYNLSSIYPKHIAATPINSNFAQIHIINFQTKKQSTSIDLNYIPIKSHSEYIQNIKDHIQHLIQLNQQNLLNQNQ